MAGFTSGLTLMVSDHHGIFIPQAFNEMYDINVWSPDTMEPSDVERIKEVLEYGPGHDHYWETWDDFMSNAKYQDGKGHTWHLYQDGDLWAYCVDLMSDEEYEDFFQTERTTA